MISALVAFDNKPAPLDLTNVFPVTPLNVKPVNDGESAVPNPKFVLAAPTVTAPVPPLTIGNAPVTEVVKSIDETVE